MYNAKIIRPKSEYKIINSQAIISKVTFPNLYKYFLLKFYSDYFLKNFQMLYLPHKKKYSQLILSNVIFIIKNIFKFQQILNLTKNLFKYH